MLFILQRLNRIKNWNVNSSGLHFIYRAGLISCKKQGDTVNFKIVIQNYSKLLIISKKILITLYSKLRELSKFIWLPLELLDRLSIQQ